MSYVNLRNVERAGTTARKMTVVQFAAATVLGALLLYLVLRLNAAATPRPLAASAKPCRAPAPLIDESAAWQSSMAAAADARPSVPAKYDAPEELIEERAHLARGGMLIRPKVSPPRARPPTDCSAGAADRTIDARVWTPRLDVGDLLSGRRTDGALPASDREYARARAAALRVLAQRQRGRRDPYSTVHNFGSPSCEH